MCRCRVLTPARPFQRSVDGALVLETSKHLAESLLGLGPERLVKREGKGLEVQVGRARALVRDGKL